MHIRKIQLSNIRGFREVDLDLTRPDGSLAGWTVLAGRNGSGKSTLLKAIALAVAGRRQPGFSSRASRIGSEPAPEKPPLRPCRSFRQGSTYPMKQD